MFPNPQLNRFQMMLQAMQGVPQPAAAPPLPNRLGQSEQLGGLPEVISPSEIGSEAIPETEESFISRRLAELYQPQTAASERLQQLVNQYPQRENPGVFSKIVGSLIGGARGPDAADRAMYGNYYRNVEDWNNQVRPVEYAANQERYYNMNQRQLADSMIRRDLDERKFEHKQKVDDKNIAIREKRVAAYDFKQRNPNMQIKVDQGTGNLIGVNPQTGQAINITGPDGQPIKGRDLSWEDRQNILQADRIELAGVRQDDRLEAIEATGKQSRITKGTPSYGDLNPDAPSNKPPSPSEQRTARTLAAETLLDEHPEWGEYIQFDGNRVIIKPETPTGIKNQIQSALEGNRDRTKNVLGAVRQSRGQEVERNPTKPQSKGPVIKTQGVAPPIEQRKVGQEHTFPNGNVGRWDGQKWVPVKVVKR